MHCSFGARDGPDGQAGCRLQVGTSALSPPPGKQGLGLHGFNSQCRGFYDSGKHSVHCIKVRGVEEGGHCRADRSSWHVVHLGLELSEELYYIRVQGEVVLCHTPNTAGNGNVAEQKAFSLILPSNHNLSRSYLDLRFWHA